jgi:hypothetical protein
MSAVDVSLVSHCAANIVPKPIEWLWPGRVAIGKQTLIAGEAGLGKSQIGIAMAAAVTTGGPWPCNEGHAPHGNVIILSAEDDPADTIVPRLLAAGADPQRVQIITAVRSEDGSGQRPWLSGSICRSLVRPSSLPCRALAWRYRAKGIVITNLPPRPNA